MLRLTRFAFRFPLLSLAAAALLTAVLGLGLPRLRLQTDGAALHPPSSPVVAQSAVDREIFRDSDFVIVLIAQRSGGPRVLSPQGFTFVREMDAALRRLPGVRAVGVRSLATLLDVQVTPRSLSAEPFLGEVPEGRAEFARLAARVRRHPLAQGVVMNPRGTAAAVYIPFVDGIDRREALARVEDLVARRRSAAPFGLHLTGPVVAEARLGDAVLTDLARLIPVIVALLCVLFWLLLRSVGALLVLFVEVSLVLVWTLGTMGHAGVPVSLVTALLPVLLMAIAVTDEIHVLERVQSMLRDRLRTVPGSRGDQAMVRDALLAAMRELERPIVAAALTTALGFFAFPFTSIEPLQHFGLFSTLGVLVAMFLSFTVAPALLVLLPARWVLPLAVARSGALRPAQLLPHERLVARLSRRGVVVACLLVVAALPGVFRLRVADNWVANFDPSSEMVRADRLFNRELWGTHRFDVVLAGPPGHFFNPRGAGLVEEIGRHAGGLPSVAGVLTYLEPLEEIARAHGERGSVAALPIARFEDFLLLSGMVEDPFGLASWLSTDGGMARIQMFLKSEDFRRDRRLAEELDEFIGARLEKGVNYHFSGDIPIGLEMVQAIVNSQLRSLGLTLLATIVLLLLVERFSWRATVAVLLPVATAAMLVFAGMGYVGVPLGVATSMFGSLTLGVGIDYGVHFLHGWRQEWHRYGEERAALAATLEKTGKALRWSLVALALGFAVLILSDLRPNRSLGALLAAAMVASYAMTLLWLPGLAPWATGQSGGERT